jgi:hypothetical protein
MSAEPTGQGIVGRIEIEDDLGGWLALRGLLAAPASRIGSIAS